MSAVHELEGITFIATKPLRAAEAAGWTPWLHAHAAAHGGALWQLRDPAPIGRPGAGHSHVVHVPGERIDEFDRATGAARDRGEATAHAETGRDHWARAGDGIVLDRDGSVTALIVAQVFCADPRRVTEWDDWYEAQHLPDMMASGAFVSGTRWRRTDPRPGHANHLTIYEISGMSVDDAIERSAAVMPDLTAAGRKHECHAGALTWALEAAG